MDELHTERLLMRQWQDADREPFAAMNADPMVMRYFPAPLGPGRKRCADRPGVSGHRGARLGPVGGGFVGLHPVPDALPCAPGIEVAWRLAESSWGRGYAPEAARPVLGFAFDQLGSTRSSRAARNEASRRVMAKIGMSHDPSRDFDHPLTPGWSGQRHVLCAISRD